MNNASDVTAAKPVRSAWFRSVARTLENCLERARTRRLLAQLNESQLSDLNISASDRLQELDKPFWR